jgi:hypothetical protein
MNYVALVRVALQKSLAPESTCRSYLFGRFYSSSAITSSPRTPTFSVSFVLLSIRMHTLHGQSKKASINSLLNPEDSSIPTHATSAGVNASQSHSHVCREAPQYPHPHPSSDGAYSLRTATWDIDGRSSHGRFGNYDRTDEQPRVATQQCSASFFDHHYHTPRLSSRQDSYSANDRWLSEQSSSYDPPFSEERNGK